PARIHAGALRHPHRSLALGDRCCAPRRRVGVVSIESIAIALHHSRATGTAKPVPAGIANHDADRGAWPSLATLPRYAGDEPRNVQSAIKKLEALHEIRRHVQAGGDHRTPDNLRPNRYQFLLACPPDCDRTSHHRTRFQPAVELDL